MTATFAFDTSADNYRIHIWSNGRDKGRISCPLATYSEAERWISEWSAGGDLRIHDRRSAGHIIDSEAS